MDARLDPRTETRRCARCGEVKPVGEFRPKYRDRGQRHSYCIPCQKAYHREWYLRNREQVVARIRRNEKERELEGKGASQINRRRRWEYLAQHPCVECGESDPVVLDFDHVRDKHTAIAELVRQDISWSRVEAEIAKCVVRCANCHRRRTAAEWRRSRAKM